MPARTFWRHIRPVLLTWYFVITVIVLAAVAIITYISYQKVNDDSVVERYRELTYLSAARLREEMSEFAQTLESVARTEDMNSGVVVRQKTALDAAHGRLSVFDAGIVVLDNYGQVVATSPERPDILGRDWSLREYFRQLVARDSVAFSGALNDGPNDARVVAVAVPVRGPAGEFNGALVGMFRLGAQTISAFNASVVRLRTTQSLNSYLVDTSGQVLYHFDETRLQENLLSNVVVREVSQGHSGAQRGSDRNGRFIVSAYAPVPGTPWGLVTEEDWETLTASSRRYGQLLLMLLALGMILPMLGSALLIRQRNREVLERERIYQEMRVASIIQKTLLPKELPEIPGWQVAAHWQPARAVGGDLYDFIPLQGGRYGLVMADVTDKGVPAGLVMASARSILRGVSERMLAPAAILERVNNLLCNDIPHNMFVTCLYADLEPATGQMTYVNAGQNLPYRICQGGVQKLDATGLPLGLLPGVQYDQASTQVQPGEFVLFYSDGVVEAHNHAQEMFGIERLEKLLSSRGNADDSCDAIIQSVLGALRGFTGTNWEQEDDITLLVLKRLPPILEESNRMMPETYQPLLEFEAPSAPGTERAITARVEASLRDVLHGEALERLKTAVAEALMNAIEHGNQGRADLMVRVGVAVSAANVIVRISDNGLTASIPESTNPDIEAKLAGLERPRGWGLFIIRHMVDEMNIYNEPNSHTIELIFHRERNGDEHEND